MADECIGLDYDWLAEWDADQRKLLFTIYGDIGGNRWQFVVEIEPTVNDEELYAAVRECWKDAAMYDASRVARDTRRRFRRA